MLTNARVFKMKTMGMLLSASVLVLFSTARAYDGKPAPKVASEAPKELEGVGIDEKLGGKIDLSLKVKDDNGQEVTLGSFFDGKHPVIISPVYFSCPGLCNFHLNGLTDALKLMDKNWTVGKKYKILSMSFDSKETPDLAAKKKETYIKLYERPEAASGWHFVTADESAVQAITQSLGFKFKWDEAAKEWAHASAAVIITPDGTISRYLPGIMFNPQDIKLALNEATEGKIGSIVDNLVLYCFKYDPHQSKYTLAAFNLMKVGGAVMVLVMVLWLLPFYIRSRRSKNKTAGR
ncbi:SCO family protein [Bdellovibrio bacteriovorus]|uniref:Photosynthetic protein synthase I n=1 Tax=Bdellovibrio bacteriovorus TaxID=959 RepID=A0A150WCC9_BDEBC|nr:SCO family protein [Bdellovibrio bacteriovorus]KYG60607.1 photosynthetic protein synthase I [Bdellovibrio bacteriovorus]